MTSTEITLESRIAADPARFRVLTGDRPTGVLHLGHYFGTLANRVRLQQAGADLFIVIADYQVFTDRDRVTGLSDTVHELVLDYLAAGVDPDSATIFTHSAVPALNQLVLPFLSLVTVGELRRNPTVKAETEIAANGGLSGLLFSYPVHQAADILFCGGNLVPVGRDQLPHIEVARLIARRFNDRYGAVFVEPEALLSEAPLVLGTDGTKMSKSRGNAIALRDDEDRTAALIKRFRTDSERAISYEPQRRPEVAALLDLAALSLDRPAEDLAEEIGDRGSAALKTLVTEAVNEYLRPLRRRRRELVGDRELLSRVLADGNRRAVEIADHTLARVREAMGMAY
jgi:tryptophanyl-tRNA synthetase